MKPDRFNQVVDNRVNSFTNLLVPKAEEYSRNGDRLWNFKEAARIDKTTPMKALRGMDLKHRVSFEDIIDDFDKGILPDKKTLAAKLDDLHNYLLLAEGLIVEAMDNEEKQSGSLVADSCGGCPFNIYSDGCKGCAHAKDV